MLQTMRRILLFLSILRNGQAFSTPQPDIPVKTLLSGWVQRYNGEWEWKEDDPTYVASVPAAEAPPAAASSFSIQSSATPQLPSKTYKPKQSLGQNYLKDPNTVAKIIRAFHSDAILHNLIQPGSSIPRVIELGPGAGALTEKLIETYGVDALVCVEIDERSVQLLQEKHPQLCVMHQDVLQLDYAELMTSTSPLNDEPLVVIGNLPYYITSQILFALADASHFGTIASATVTMQWEVAQRIVAKPNSKDYGILSVVFQLYGDDVKVHFKIPPTVFYPKPKVDSALVGIHFCSKEKLLRRLGGVSPKDLRRVVTTSFQQRRKTLRNSLKNLACEIGSSEKLLADHSNWNHDSTTGISLPNDWASMRPEQLTPAQFVAVTRLLFGSSVREDAPLPAKVWRKLKHGANE